MKFVSALALAVGSAVAQKTTDNDCLLEQGATLKEECSDLFYNICESYTLEADSSCNVNTYSDSQIDWFSSDLYVVNWYYIEGVEEVEEEEEEDADEEETDSFYVNNFQAEDEDDEDDDDEDEEDNVPCVLDSEIPTQYKKGTRMQLFSGLCGFKYQITNTNVEATYTFNVLRDGAFALTASAVSALAAVALF